jgi:hypothetical protein
VETTTGVLMCDRLEAQHASHEGDAAWLIVGTLIVTLVPALFWTTVFAALGAALGHMPSALAMATFGSAIAAFLAGLWHALLTRAVPA